MKTIKFLANYIRYIYQCTKSAGKITELSEIMFVAAVSAIMFVVLVLAALADTYGF